MEAACATALAEFQAASARAVDAFVRATGDREAAILQCEASILQRQASVAERETAVTYSEETVRKREADLQEVMDSKAGLDDLSGRLPASPVRAHSRLLASASVTPCAPFQTSTPGTTHTTSLKDLWEHKAMDSREKADAAKRRSSGQGLMRRSSGQGLTQKASCFTSSFGFSSYGLVAAEECGLEGNKHGEVGAPKVNEALAAKQRLSERTAQAPSQAEGAIVSDFAVCGRGAGDVQQSLRTSVSGDGQRALYEKLFDFYMLHNPGKLLADESSCPTADDSFSTTDNAHVLEVVRFYYDKQAELNQNLRKTYGVDLSSLGGTNERAFAPTASSPISTSTDSWTPERARAPKAVSPAPAPNVDYWTCRCFHVSLVGTLCTKCGRTEQQSDQAKFWLQSQMLHDPSKVDPSLKDIFDYGAAVGVGTSALPSAVRPGVEAANSEASPSPMEMATNALKPAVGTGAVSVTRLARPSDEERKAII